MFNALQQHFAYI